MNVDPLPGVVSPWICPPDWATILNTVESPSPVPCPGALVVKKGSKMRTLVASSIPVPVSVMAIRTNGPALRSGSGRAASVGETS